MPSELEGLIFFLLFWWKSDLGLSWKHLRSIMGRLGRIFWVVLAPKTPSLGPKTPPRWAQDPQENKTKIVVIRGPCSRAAQERPRAIQGAPERMGYPSWGRFLDHFFIDFWFALDLHFIGILTGSFQEFSESNPEMKASSWKTVAATRALFFARTPSILESFERQVTSQARWRARRVAALWINIEI